MPDLSLLRSVCHLAADPGYFTGLHHRLAERAVVAAVQAHDTPALFAWLVEVLSFQGISDAAALTFMDQHGRAQWRDIEQGLQRQPTCSKLTSHWHFHRCGFTRSHRGVRSLPTIRAVPCPLCLCGNGALNRMAYGLFLFIRDVCQDDLVGWIDAQLEAVPDPCSSDYPERLGQAVIGPLR